jgi:hypothetical protein
MVYSKVATKLKTQLNWYNVQGYISLKCTKTKYRLSTTKYINKEAMYSSEQKYNIKTSI